MTPKRRRLWLLVGSLATLGVAATLVLTALNDNLVFFYSPTQVADPDAAHASAGWRSVRASSRRGSKPSVARSASA